MIVRIAAIQFEPKQFEKEQNIARLYRMVEEAARNGAKLITTPEMATTGYCWYDREEVAPFVETIPGETTKTFHSIAEKYDCYIVIGMPEVDPETNLYYNSAVLIGPEGVVGKHRKTHPYISEPKWAASGNLGHPVFETKIGRVAMLICMDIHFVETARTVGLNGADVICHISNWLAERTPAPYWINRAYENQCYLIESNRWGLERTVQFSGGSCIINPDGSVQAVLDSGDGIVYGEMDLAESRKKQVLEDEVFKDRKPDMYAEIMTNTYLWNPLDFFGLYGKNPLPPGKQSKIAVAQIELSENKQRNLSQIEEKTIEAKNQGAELVVFPELSISGPDPELDTAESVPGKSTNRLIQLSLKYGMYLVAGLVEEDAGHYYNTAILTGPEGVVGKYRKIHLNASDKKWATAGDQWATFDLPIGRVGLLIGYDTVFPESGRILSLRGCDVILCPSRMKSPLVQAHEGTQVSQNYPIPTGADPYHWHLHRVRAGENNVYLAFANEYNPEAGYPGNSGIFGPDTFSFPRKETIIGEGSAVGVATVDTGNLSSPYPTNVVRRKDLVLIRQPHFYQDLIKKEGKTEGVIVREPDIPIKSG